MSIKRSKRPSATIEVGSFSDIAFLLIIFFILTTSLARFMGRPLDVPSASSEKAKDQKRSITISILPDKVLYGQDEKPQEETTVAGIRQVLREMKLKEKPVEDRMIVVSVGQHVQYDSFFKLATAIGEAGGIVTLMEEEGAKEGETGQ